MLKEQKILQGQDLEIYKKISEAITKFDKSNFTYSLKNYSIGYFMVWDSDGKAYQYIAYTGEILGRKEIGINDFIRILRGEF